MKKFSILVLLIVGLVTVDLFSQSLPPKTIQLSNAISRDYVTLTARGNGKSTGLAVSGNLMNKTSQEIFINVNLNDGFYLSNSGAGQNMIATQVLYADTRFYTNGNSKFISLPPNENVQIIFIAFCADFFHDNPRESEEFTWISMPSRLRRISSNISRFMADNLNDFHVKPVQLALWNYQGLSPDLIALKYESSSSDWSIAAGILDY